MKLRVDIEMDVPEPTYEVSVLDGDHTDDTIVVGRGATIRQAIDVALARCPLLGLRDGTTAALVLHACRACLLPEVQ